MRYSGSWWPVKDAHERHYPTMFRTSEYGFNLDMAYYSRDVAQKIRALKVWP